MIKRSEYEAQQSVLTDPIVRIDALAVALGLTFTNGAYEKTVKIRREYKKHVKAATKHAVHKRLPNSVFEEARHLAQGEMIDITQEVARHGLTLKEVAHRAEVLSHNTRRRNNRPNAKFMVVRNDGHTYFQCVVH